ncbi:hypothetical protein LAZ67_4003824 [Cordylochernes scorpioides]|uniref:Uncharacterized protein n=1 Tax=Cordylochernes scorpioides TaxID=51811 RepID=A0ABY6KF05_9ARAC|nr:hypothetical protein LAZ67_4003824 [Cordylochernes scorpioides]
MKYDRRTHLEEFQIDDLVCCKNFRGDDKWIPGKIVGKKGTSLHNFDPRTGKGPITGIKLEKGGGIVKKMRVEMESVNPSTQEEQVPSLSPGLTSQRSDQDSEVQSDTDDGKSLEPLRSLDPEAMREEGPVLRRNPPRSRIPPDLIFVDSNSTARQSSFKLATVSVNCDVEEGAIFLNDLEAKSFNILLDLSALNKSIQTTSLIKIVTRQYWDIDSASVFSAYTPVVASARLAALDYPALVIGHSTLGWGVGPYYFNPLARSTDLGLDVSPAFSVVGKLYSELSELGSCVSHISESQFTATVAARGSRHHTTGQPLTCAASLAHHVEEGFDFWSGEDIVTAVIEMHIDF